MINPYEPPSFVDPPSPPEPLPPEPRVIRTPRSERIRNAVLRYSPKTALLFFLLFAAFALAHYFGYDLGIPSTAVSIGIFAGASLNGVVQGLKNDNQTLIQHAINLLLTPPLAVGWVRHPDNDGRPVKGILCLSETEARFRPKQRVPGFITLKLEDVAQVMPDVRAKRLTLLGKDGRRTVFHTACSAEWKQKFDEVTKARP